MNTEFIIIISVVVIIFVAFELLSERENRKLIEKYKKHIADQDKYIKTLESNRNILTDSLYKVSKEFLKDKL